MDQFVKQWPVSHELEPMIVAATCIQPPLPSTRRKESCLADGTVNQRSSAPGPSRSAVQPTIKTVKGPRDRPCYRSSSLSARYSSSCVGLRKPVVSSRVVSLLVLSVRFPSDPGPRVSLVGSVPGERGSPVGSPRSEG
jgi:hypothetical protein